MEEAVYSLSDATSAGIVGVGMKMTPEVLKELVRGAPAALRLASGNGGSLTIGSTVYTVSWLPEPERAVEYFALDQQSQQLVRRAHVLGKVAVVPNLNASKHEEIKNRTEEALQQSKKRKSEVLMERPEKSYILERTTRAKRPKKTSAAIPKAETVLPVNQSDTRSSVLRWINVISVPLSVTRNAIINFLDGLGVEEDNVRLGGFNPKQNTVEVFAKLETAIGASQALHRCGEEMQIKGHGSVRAALKLLNTNEIMWMKPLTILFPTDSTPASEIISCLQLSLPSYALLPPPSDFAATWVARRKYAKREISETDFKQLVLNRMELCSAVDMDSFVSSVHALISFLYSIADRVLITNAPVWSVAKYKVLGGSLVGTPSGFSHLKVAVHVTELSRFLTHKLRTMQACMLKARQY